MTGRLIAIVGPSGVGKDSLMHAARAQGGVTLARRVITRPSDSGGENFDGVSEAEFTRQRDAGAFLLDWPAHGLRYGIPVTVQAEVAAGRVVLFNGSRAAIATARRRLLDLRVILITADHAALAARLAARGRETADDIQDRLRRAVDFAGTVQADATIDNSGDFDAARHDFLAAIDRLTGARTGIAPADAPSHHQGETRG